jgi:hypothetical protein
VHLYWIMGGTVLLIVGIVIFLRSWSGLPDDQLFQGHPVGEPFNEEQQAAYQRYQIFWAIAAGIGIGGVVAIAHGLRKKGKLI